MVSEVFRVAADFGPWGVVALLGVLAAKSRPVRELSRVIEIEIRWRYLRTKGFSKKELRRLLFDDFDLAPPEILPPKSGPAPESGQTGAPDPPGPNA